MFPLCGTLSIASPIRRRWIHGKIQRVTGMETWFSLPNLKTIGPPPRWKMAIVSFIGAYSISLLAQYILRLYLPLLTNIIMTIILVLGLTYFAMPVLSRLLRRWLYPRNVWHVLSCSFIKRLPKGLLFCGCHLLRKPECCLFIPMESRHHPFSFISCFEEYERLKMIRTHCRMFRFTHYQIFNFW
jgi:hypothetical protein